MHFQNKPVRSVRLVFQFDDEAMIFEGSSNEWEDTCLKSLRQPIPKDLPLILNLMAPDLRKG